VTPGLVVRAAAAADIEDAHAWYERARPGLGEEFLAAVKTAVDRVRDNPGLYPVVHRDTWRALLPRFPYAPFYRAEPDRILVTACFHAKRDPLVWQSGR
jgi:plasmid stabilization system protein ParE